MGIGSGTLEAVVMSSAFWKGRRVFLTGHTGFKGSWLCIWLHQMGAIVTGYSLEAEKNGLFDRSGAAQFVDSQLGDVRDEQKLLNSMRNSGAEIVIHMAAQALVRASYTHPVETFATNVMGTVNVLEAARQVSSIRAVLNVTTDKCYHNQEWVWGYRETEPLGGHDPYSASKACSEIVTSAYRSSFAKDGHLAMATARAGNVIGGGDFAQDRLVPDIVRAFTEGKSPVLRNPQAIRPWQHVLEPLSGYLTLAQSLLEHGQRDAQAWNLGPWMHDCRPVSWIAQRIGQELGSQHVWQQAVGESPHEANTLKLDISLAVERLGWMPRLDIAQAVDWTARWYRLALEGGDALKLCQDQIQAYVDLSYNNA
jgi:CDP-glucose 4,6-dehydratase